MKKNIIILLLFLFALSSNAQQDPQYTQYMYNMNVINPAYAGSVEGIGIGMLYRNQWEGLEGAPTTGTVNIHSSIGKNVGLGVSVISDKIGPVKENNIYADFSYTLNLSNSNNLAFGLKAGFTTHDIGLAGLALIDDFDPAFADNVNEITPNIGAGIYFYNPNQYYVSISMPNILNSIHLDTEEYDFGSETPHLFAAAGYIYDISEDFKLKPHVFLKYAFDSPASIDINANLFMYDLVEIGVGYRLDDAITAMINFQVSPSVRIGYAYDNTQSELNYYTKSSHEIFINFDISFRTKVSRSPRYF